MSSYSFDYKHIMIRAILGPQLAIVMPNLTRDSGLKGMGFTELEKSL
jgi:hypothetical protein